MGNLTKEILAYRFMLDEAHLGNLANDIPKIWSQFLSEVESFLTDKR